MDQRNAEDIVIVGAGALGLSSALALCENLPNIYQITVVSEHSPDSVPYDSKYTSPWAGAHFRPFPSKNEAELREYPLTRLTLQRMKRFAKECPESSVKLAKGIEYLEEPSEQYKHIAEGYSEGIDNFKVLKELPKGFKFGASYDTYVVNAPVYLEYVYRKLRAEYGVRFVKSRLGRLSEALLFTSSPSPIIINCTGNGLQWTGGTDPACFPIRGQTLLVNAAHDNSLADTTVTVQHRSGQWTFCINRPLNGGTIIGGTKQPYDTDPSPRHEDTMAILTRASKLFPQLMRKDKNGQAYFDIIRTNVGFRPARHGGLNLSVERHGTYKVINAYGAGGSGFELSYGVGLKVVETLRTTHRESQL
ncbi:hypothetical protein ACI3LY_004324 [Candidozyma auris]|uniref:FAD dependent oxidoreductase domain-containing protein n=2 Tax=Candidozyma auris TaxID=498019 RepID=A0AB36VXS0_CANAR|nr:hypothetical protein QG37_01211 [[Candida] auris]PIS48371.1 hypothetical protein B9J08_005061 [[Candida] auris]PIS48984.1 hypothetical protein CJI97_005145 [[Candida] auris]QWW24845.1 hypothetical protein CA7LBN_003702 [[Candida] auris]